ncbi:hypothetical protein B7C42_06891 [Nocardia cerradoensis]|uniref:Uncharacterized protein n=1 Tax=Nocardia cerradoensis TaxID=85688 RepID=A0A231GX93_9NOCA|nr:hypothetical protein [Nocardia cerradoensis]OXR41121.1 hypothetical protein B7C42_06891 [Nocardia cerradoensis]
MSRVTALLRLEAMETMRAVPITQFRHRRLSSQPLVVVPLAMAGEAGAPLAAIVGRARHAPTLLVVEQPRDRVQRFVFAADLGRKVMEHIDSCRVDRPDNPTTKNAARSYYTDAPQILVPNPGGIAFLANLGRACRFRETGGDYPVPAGVPEFGRWLTFLADSAEQTGTSMLMAVTDLLAEHWATGQSSLEDQNLASLTAWIAPPARIDVEQAILDAEDPTLWPPAGPVTDPTFDTNVLYPALRDLDEARALGDQSALSAARTELRELLSEQINPTWRMMWQAISLLRAVPEAPSVERRFVGDRARFTAFSDHQDSTDARPQPARDGAVAAARRLARLERALADFEAETAMDDPFVLADRRSIGEAFAGEVIDTEPGRVVRSGKNRRTLRPLVTIRTLDPTRLADGTELISPHMPSGHKATIVSTVREEPVSLVTVEVTAGMGTPKTPKPEAVPDLGCCLAYLPNPGWRPNPVFPDRDDTPWTHINPAVADSDGAIPDDISAEEWGDDD